MSEVLCVNDIANVAENKEEVEDVNEREWWKRKFLFGNTINQKRGGSHETLSFNSHCIWSSHILYTQDGI